LTKLDDNVKKIFDTFGIPCYGNHGQIAKTSLGYSRARPGEHLEFDFVARVNRIGLIIESTAERRNQRREIRKFVNHCEEFENAPISLQEKIRLLRGIPNRAKRDFELIMTWKYVYIGTSDELIQLQLDESTFPGKPLYVLNREHYEYLSFLCDRLGEFGKYEFLRRLDISPQQAGEVASEVRVRAVCLSGRKISKGMDIVDLYAFKMRVYDLLKIARVVRYGSLESWVPELGTSAYQRLLNPNKLKGIRDFLNKERGKSSFPNAITVVFSPRVTITESEHDGELVIPIEYGSVEVIDGQHRLFAFGKSGLRSRELEEAQLLVIGVKFRDSSDRKRQQWSARTFIEINRSQTKVPTELIQLIANSVMGERTPTALAARVLVELNISSGVLRDVFYTRPFQKVNRVGGRPVRIVTVTKELAPLLDKRNELQISTRGVYETFSEESWRLHERGHDNRIISECKSVLKRYFAEVAQVFRDDWNSNESLVFTSKYLAAFCKLFVEFRKRRMDYSQIRNQLNQLKTNIISYLTSNSKTLGVHNEVLWKNNAAAPAITGSIPPARGSFSDIYEFLKEKAQLP
jgi:DGQHR domain-containing protein